MRNPVDMVLLPVIIQYCLERSTLFTFPPSPRGLIKANLMVIFETIFYNDNFCLIGGG